MCLWLGLARTRRWLYQHATRPTWRLTDFLDRRWNDQWLMHQRRLLLTLSVRL
jgi:hypothetical protein